jgi:hypothetical protein
MSGRLREERQQRRALTQPRGWSWRASQGSRNNFRFSLDPLYCSVFLLIPESYSQKWRSNNWRRTWAATAWSWLMRRCTHMAHGRSLISLARICSAPRQRQWGTHTRLICCTYMGFFLFELWIGLTKIHMLEDRNHSNLHPLLHVWVPAIWSTLLCQNTWSPNAPGKMILILISFSWKSWKRRTWLNKLYVIKMKRCITEWKLLRQSKVPCYWNIQIRKPAVGWSSSVLEDTRDVKR